MRYAGNIQMHVIDETTDHVLLKRVVSCAPMPTDEIRLGGNIGVEKYYTVTRVVWVYDEPDCPFERVNIGVKLAV